MQPHGLSLLAFLTAAACTTIGSFSAKGESIAKERDFRDLRLN
jgi:hypothetical protein